MKFISISFLKFVMTGLDRNMQSRADSFIKRDKVLFNKKCAKEESYW